MHSANRRKRGWRNQGSQVILQDSYQSERRVAAHSGKGGGVSVNELRFGAEVCPNCAVGDLQGRVVPRRLSVQLVLRQPPFSVANQNSERVDGGPARSPTDRPPGGLSLARCPPSWPETFALRMIRLGRQPSHVDLTLPSGLKRLLCRSSPHASSWLLQLSEHCSCLDDPQSSGRNCYTPENL